MAKRAIQSPQERFKRYESAQSQMNLWKGLLEDAYLYTIPNRSQFFLVNPTAGAPTSNQIFDSTALLGVQSFANNLQSILMPPFRRWAKLIPGEEVPESEKEQIEAALQQITATLFKFLDQSNFAQVINEALQDLSVGTGIILLNEGPTENPFQFLSVPISHVALEGGADDKLENFYRRWEVPVRQVKRLWPQAVLTQNMERQLKRSPELKVNLIEGTIFYPDNDEGSQYYYYIQDKETKTDILSEFRPFSPWIGFRFSKSPGEIVGRGPVLTALPTIRVLNKVVELELRSAKFRAFPAYMAASTSVLNPYNLVIEPGSIIPIEAQFAGGSPITPIPAGGDPRFVQTEIQALQSMVREILFSAPLTPNPVPNQSATEISIRQQNWLRESGSSAGRLTVELLRPIIMNCLIIMERKGLSAPIKVDGKRVSIQYESPLLDIQSQEDVLRAQQWIQSLQVMYGQFSVLAFKAAEYPQWSAEKMNVDLKLVQDAQKIKQDFQSLQQDIEQKLGAQQAPQQAPQQVPTAAPGEVPPVTPFTGIPPS